MRVELRRTGGIVPSVQGRSLVIDSATLAPEDVRALESLVTSSGILDLPDTPSPAMPDAFTYVVTVDVDGRRSVVRLAERTMPDGVRALVAWITKHGTAASPHDPH